MILDALLPANPATRANVMPPPQGVIEAAATIGHLERLLFEGVITDSEFESERAVSTAEQNQSSWAA